MVTKQKTLILIPLIIIGGFLFHSWVIILFTDLIANWRHYLPLDFYNCHFPVFQKSDSRSYCNRTLFNNGHMQPVDAYTCGYLKFLWA